ncbi:LysR family transcriptional regulator [Flavitalea sp. BT771]|uniref:LysR family transcriptional regulator n=1 Tax=Flavitalea sp. BT771 TaxID=3063329 RepID=UPI0026E1CC01|nr:LysR family transcriptional regulator [Flavitalea sp. BT771]MDO6435315.1 LysR family transcriptional regulator [Flavitalea sp. BT771]MDV6224325.1 LysR family transcriptional regulator [Flavitalea sp. BT771]
MTFDFRLQVFHTVASRLNFTKAAKELFITQPAVTRHIHELEQHFKVKLFERNGTRIRLAPAGKLLLQHTEDLFALYRKMEFDMSSLNQEQNGRLNLGGSMTAAPYVIPPILSEFHKRYEKVKVSLITGNTQQMEDALERKEIDLAVVEGHSRNASIRYTEFMKDRIVLVSNPSHPLAKRQGIRPEELLRIPLLLREPGSGTLEVLAHALKGVGIKLSQLQKEMQLDSTEVIKSYLLRAPCMAFLSVHAVLKELQNKECSIVEVKGLNIERNFYFARLQGEAQALPELFMRFAMHYNKRTPDNILL